MQTNWLNLNFKDSATQSLNIIDPLDFGTLTLEVSCNIASHKLSEETLEAQFQTDLAQAIENAKTIWEANKSNYLKFLKEEARKK